MPAHSDTQSTIAHDAVSRVLSVALANARARGAQWQSLADEFLGSTELALKNIEKIRLELLRNQSAPARAMSEMNERVLALLERLADTVWAERGQSPQDPFISILSPGTPNFFFDWTIGRPVDRLDILLELFGGDAIPSVQSAEVAAILGDIRALLPEFRMLNEDVRAFRARLDVLEKSSEVVARVGHVQYARLRRRMRAEGFDAFEVRKVLPDIPGASSGTLQ